ncbi:tRNA guanosine(15) transglycosylase TgtA [Halococcoides cellulosivorans]|uniref:tRNA-guanine(15) transglycosylase n=1 Tax=Halococcoides cellulosivorans TaxID=1679096 RepID=A0A2R4WZT6_9EURY|nr:tRNA guanosine(15) transglycosylase TgtA [Halococcoides cellulosivorans]AWB27053.1 tRNA guanosine(15) transglycosylase TgtA [Halococcoides cellulosivorans]
MTEGFEIRRHDAAGRLGEFSIPGRETTVRTPALMPVVNPHLDSIPPGELDAFGAQLLITNGYIVYTSDEYRDRARSEGIHEVLGFDGPIVTDSGSFQLSEYGSVDVSNEEILEFQAAIGADVVTPLDVPTPPDVPRERAADDLAVTTERIERAADLDLGDALVNAPVQGSTFPDLREQSGAVAAASGLDVAPVGAVVPLLREYRYATVIETVLAAKRGLGPAMPVHLFGAGHPMMFALAAAVGCDLFDSAAYARYARDDRYLTVRATTPLDELRELPCSCPVCVDTDPTTLRDADSDRRERALARHNLHVSLEEMRRVRQAIHRGRLLELVETRARGHPAVLDGYRRLLDASAALEAHDPVSKDTFFYCSAESARRPEVTRHHDRLERLDPPDSLVLVDEAVAGVETSDAATVWPIRPPFGPVPTDLRDTYPLTAELPERRDRDALQAAVAGIERLDPPPERVVHDGWPEAVLADCPGLVESAD